MTKTPIYKRIVSLEDSGYITGYVALVDRKLVGLPLMVFCAVSLNIQNAEFIYYNKITNGKYSGTASKSDLGLGSDDKIAKGNPNKAQNHAHRMAILNGLMRKHLTYFFIQKQVE